METVIADYTFRIYTVSVEEVVVLGVLLVFLLDLLRPRSEG